MNILVVMLDSLRPDHLAFNGHPYVKTPNLDRLASESVVFTNAIVEFPITIPCRTALVTGKYAFTNRPWIPLRDGEITLAQRLADIGFHTCGFTDSPFNRGMNMHWGFEEFYWVPGGKCAPLINPNRKVDLSNVYYSPEQSDLDKQLCYQSLTNEVELRETEGMYFPDLTTREVCKWLENYKSDKDFFLWIDYFEPHEPWAPPKEYVDMYDPDYDGRFIPMPDMKTEFYTERELRHIVASYDACVTMADEQIGKLRNCLEKLNLWDDTMLIVLSDHGEPFGEHGTIRKFYVPPYDELAKMVYIIRDPQKPKTARIDALVQNADFAPTILNRVGITPTDMEGIDLNPLIDGKTNAVREFAYSGAFQLRSHIRDTEWKFIDNQGEKENELYNLIDDPKETRNLVEVEPDIARKLHRDLWEFRMQWSGVSAWRQQTVVGEDE